MESGCNINCASRGYWHLGFAQLDREAGMMILRVQFFDRKDTARGHICVCV